MLKVAPETAFTARANRAFLGRVVRYLAGQEGVRQFAGTDILAPGTVRVEDGARTAMTAGCPGPSCGAG